ncbi:ABC transporter substrate-binding protein [Nocardia panacis]|uniref:ABC transporter substrate-binding protein n=1 Tax=Nocardia panacis TaxID=2340916 RepID=A0A3A4KEC5_9NOCA|nr:ABC transporter substrate-binding protein [Nocardia panacis]RJO70809.1 ABC transporter substrate-binding protein [Nocardia panacis]
MSRISVPDQARNEMLVERVSRRVDRGEVMRTFWFRSRALAALAFACALLLTACGGATEQSGPKTHLTIGALPILDDAPLFIAVQEGFFKQEGLTVSTKIVAQSTQALPSLLHGDIDIISGGNYVSYFQGNARGAFDVQVLAAASTCASDAFGVLTLPDSGVRTPADLAGKKIAVNLVNNVQTLLGDTLLKSSGIDTGGIHYVQIPFAEMDRALSAHQVDAISVVEPFLSGAQHSGAVQVMSLCTGPTEKFPLSGYFATRDWVGKNPLAARAFQRAMARAQQVATDNRAAVERIIPTYTAIGAQDAQRIRLGGYPVGTDAEQLQRVADLMKQGGMLDAPLDVRPLIYHP